MNSLGCSFSESTLDIFYSFLERYSQNSTLAQKALERRQTASVNFRDFELIASICRWASVLESAIFFDSGNRIILLRDHFELKETNLFSRATGERIKFANLICDSRYKLDDQSMRKLFAIVELSLFQLLQITVWNLDRKISYEDVTLSGLVKDVRKNCLLSAINIDILERMRETRNEFAHSILGIGDIKYCGRPLKNSLNRISRRSNSAYGSIRRLFVHDLYSLTDEIISRISMVQHRQLDLRKVAAVLSCEFPIEIYRGRILLSGYDVEAEERMRSDQGLENTV